MMFTYTPTVTAESDDDLRRRIAYVAADGQWLTRLIMEASGERLDEIASHYNLRRRRQ